MCELRTVDDRLGLGLVEPARRGAKSSIGHMENGQPAETSERMERYACSTPHDMERTSTRAWSLLSSVLTRQ